jgi:bifunctional polynucleotide phosphatase/kinase
MCTNIALELAGVQSFVPGCCCIPSEHCYGQNMPARTIGCYIAIYAMQELQASGHKLVIFSNQALIRSALTGKAAGSFGAKINAVLTAARVTATVCAATMKDCNRKPAQGMWEFFKGNCNRGQEIDTAASFYVGDAAGRPGDHSADDMNFAEGAGLPFKLPEELFGAAAAPA